MKHRSHVNLCIGLGCALLLGSLSPTLAEEKTPAIKPTTVPPRAAPAATVPRPPRQFRLDRRVDLPLTTVGIVSWIASNSAQADLIGKRGCRWCDRHADGSDGLNRLDAGIRTALRWDRPRVASTVSNATGYVLAPLFAFGLDALAAGQAHQLRGFGADFVLILESVVAAIDVNQLTKDLVLRERPFIHVLPAAAKAGTDTPEDNNTSFFSGHTTAAFALAVSAGTVSSLRRYRLAPLVWVVGLLTAATTGYLRIAADRHYFTDVLVGALVGAGAGVGIPFAHLVPQPRGVKLRVSTLPFSGGAGLALAGRW